MSATPGPWHTDGSEIFAADGTWIGETLDIDLPDDGQANAKLAAAAPDLLAALKALREADRNSDQSEVCNQADAAIAKAEGLEP